uniref:Putative secreted peptide n=1 Tax=Anopheles braziliensis TaxID=58242 RepID=A0A2M3ZTQ2_9DIPT
MPSNLWDRLRQRLLLLLVVAIHRSAASNTTLLIIRPYCAHTLAGTATSLRGGARCMASTRWLLDPGPCLFRFQLVVVRR